MNSFIKYIPASLNDHKAFIELILSIIDTKLQFVKHRTDTLIASYDPILYDVSTHLTELNPNWTTSSEEVLLAGREEIFSLIEEYSKCTNLLLTMRAQISAHNVSRIYDLLSNDHYLHFEQEELLSMLKVKERKS